MYKIGQFSILCRTPIKTLRYYDEINLLKPEKVDKCTSYRLYTTNQLIQIHYINSLKQIGFSIKEIKSMMSGHDMGLILNSKKSELQSELIEINDKLSKLNFILDKKEEEVLMKYQAVIKNTPECIVYSKKMLLPNYDALFTLIPKLGEKVQKANPDLKCLNPEYCFVAELDKEYKEKNISIEYCEAVTDYGNEVDGIEFKKIESVKVVSAMHKGSYDNISNVFNFLFKWINENNYEIIDYPRLSYIDGIWNKDCEDEWLTELQIPIR